MKMERVVQLTKAGLPSVNRSGAAPELPPGTQLGGVVVEKLLGSGWEGAAYRVRGAGSRKRRVLKCYRRRPGLAPALALRVRHRRSMRGCTVVPPLESELRLVMGQREWPAWVLRYAPGESLLAIHGRHPSGRIPLDRARSLLLAVLRSLAQLHARGSYHGDLHEGNILISRCGRGIRAHLVDPFPQSGCVQALQDADLVQLVRMFSSLLGGAAAYAQHPGWIREILRGGQARRILARFPNVTELQRFVQRSIWRGSHPD